MRHLAAGGHETFHLVKANPEYPDFLISYSVHIRAELCLIYILVRYHTYQDEFFASEVAHF